MICVLLSDNWNRYLDMFPNDKKDIYFFEEYVKLYEDRTSSALCAIALENDRVLLMPVIRKAIGDYFDFETPYGYGGPLANTDDARWIQDALVSLYDLFARQNYVAGFVRFHPLLRNDAVSTPFLKPIFDRYTVCMDLLPSSDNIFSNQISSKNRNMIKKAQKESFSFYADYEFKHIDEFVAIYKQTMERLSANDFYFFNASYYNKFIEKLRNKAFLGCVQKDGVIYAAALFMYSSIYGHYHLAGSLRSGSHGLNNLLLWGAALEMKKNGVKKLHLGGGTDSDLENPLFKFKKNFSNVLQEFHIGKLIFNQLAYNSLCKQWEENNPDKKDLYKNLLLKYRC